MGQISVEIMRLHGSLLSGNQHVLHLLRPIADVAKMGTRAKSVKHLLCTLDELIDAADILCAGLRVRFAEEPA